MVSADDVARVPLYAGLSADEQERLARVAADVHLGAGEYAAHEGDERALYAVLEGRIEAVKLTDGVERVVGQRQPGEIFGEVPITLGAGFPVSFRAAEATRVMRVEARDYHALASTAPDLVSAVGKLAAERIGGPRGLQGIAAEPPPPRAVVVGHSDDGDGAELRRFLERNQISFRWVPLDATSAGEPADGGGYPVVRFADGTTVVRPTSREVADRLGLQTCADADEYDTLIVGAGPAGLAAAVYGASEGLRTIVIEREAPGGQAGTSSRIENYLGFPSGVSGDELSGRALQQARRLGAEILVTRSIVRIDPSARAVHLDGGDVLHAPTIILATGVAWRRLEIEGVDRLGGVGVHYGAARGDAPSTHGLDVHIVGAGNSAGQAALAFASHARSVTILHRGDALEKSMSRYLVDQLGSRANIVVSLRSEVVAVHGDTSLREVDVRDHATGATTRHESGGLYIFIGADAETAWLPPEIARDQRGYVLTGADIRAAWREERDPYLLETSVPGIFACGDVRFSPVKRVAAAVGEGSMAIAFVHQYLRSVEPTPA
jgi:thioredoxin reductase (NADPH)